MEKISKMDKLKSKNPDMAKFTALPKRRKSLSAQLQKESKLARNESMKVLAELEKIR